MLRSTSRLLSPFVFAVVTVGALRVVAAPPDLPTARGTTPPAYGSLDPYGDWRVVEPWGWVWSPMAVTTDWRPYTLGTWANGPHGWTWYEEEPWGAITYHYGRWTRDREQRWLWVPGATWAPAAVAWRAGGGYLGWAPLPPDPELAANAGDLPEATWVFVRTTDLENGRLPVAALPLTRNALALARTAPSAARELEAAR